jgi:hypothetical protein
MESIVDQLRRTAGDSAGSGSWRISRNATDPIINQQPFCIVPKPTFMPRFADYCASMKIA